MAKLALFERTAVSANGTKRTTQLHPRLSVIRVTANKGGLSWEMPRSAEACEPCLEIGKELLCLVLMLKADDGVVRIAHDNNIAGGASLAPPVGP
jgi:hypothetical protein